MKCILLCAPGEVLEGSSELDSLGYHYQAYPTTQAVEILEDTRDEEFASFLGARPESCDKPYVRSLRASFSSMLQDSQFDDEEYVIFGESDATPIIAAQRLATIIERWVEQYPDVDVFRLFHDLSNAPSDLPSITQDEFKHYVSNPMGTWCTPYVWGTHALIIPCKKREKIAQLFLSCRLPIDTTLEVAQARGEINIMVAEYNFFYQKPRTHFVDKRTMYSWRERKMALCLSSYKRFEDLQRQIYSMMDQSYPHFHLFVAVKGLSEYIFMSILMPQFQGFIDEGRLTLRYFPNKNQLSNFIDTVRNLDVSDYELFLKIDDDDFYSRDYLKNINEFHAAIPQHHSSYYSDLSDVHYRHHGVSSLQQEYFSIFGASMVFSREVMRQLVICEETPSLMEPVVQRWLQSKGHCQFGFSEDNFMHMLMRDYGCSNIASFIRQKGIEHHLIIQKANASVTRGDFLTDHFREANDKVANNASTFEYIVELRHPEWYDSFVIVGQRGYRTSISDAAHIVSFTSKKLIVNWDQWGEETFIKTSNGFYLYAMEEKV